MSASALNAAIRLEKTPYGGWPNCLRLSNGSIELIVTADVGPRVIRLGYMGGQNLFGTFENQLGKAGDDEFRLYGGHRLWHAPEQRPRSYWPDNQPVAHEWDGRTLKLTAPLELDYGVQKEIELTLEADADRVRVLHRISNRSHWDIELAPWGASIMALHGRVIVPQEPYRPHTEDVTPARPLVLWSYTDMQDPRWTWGSTFIQLRQDPSRARFQKAGMLNTQGWMAFVLAGEVLIKRYPAYPQAAHADFGCNTEVFVNAEWIEMETLGPLTRLAPGASVEHVEQWSIHKRDLPEAEEALKAALAPLIAGE